MRFDESWVYCERLSSLAAKCEQQLARRLVALRDAAPTIRVKLASQEESMVALIASLVSEWTEEQRHLDTRSMEESRACFASFSTRFSQLDTSVSQLRDVQRALLMEV